MKRTVCFFLSVFLLSIQTINANEVPEVVSEYVYIYNLDEQQSIYEKNADAKLYPASMTKIMTALVVLEQIQNLQTMITITPEVLEGLAEQSASVAGFSVGESVSAIDLLYGVMLPSGADATRALAFHISGSEEAFVRLMNEKAKVLNLKSTHFVNSSGLHDDEHYSSAKDMAIILQEALKSDIFRSLFAADQYTTGPTILHLEGLNLTSTKLKLMINANLEPFLSGGKTGYTVEGGLCLASTLEVNGASYIVITANAGQQVENAQHLKDTNTLKAYLEDTYTKEEIFKGNDSVGNAKVFFGKQDYVEVIVKEDVSIFKRKQDASNYEIHIEDVYAPIEENIQVGTLTVIREGDVYNEITLYAKEKVEQNTLWIFVMGGSVLLLVLAIGVGSARCIRRKRNTV